MMTTGHERTGPSGARVRATRRSGQLVGDALYGNRAHRRVYSETITTLATVTQQLTDGPCVITYFGLCPGVSGVGVDIELHNQPNVLLFAAAAFVAGQSIALGSEGLHIDSPIDVIVELLTGTEAVSGTIGWWQPCRCPIGHDHAGS